MMENASRSFQDFVNAQYQTGYDEDGDEGIRRVNEWLQTLVASTHFAKHLIVGGYGEVSRADLEQAFDTHYLVFKGKS